MSERRYPVHLAGKHYTPEFQTDPARAKLWKRVLERNYGQHGRCLCPGKGERKLAIKRREDSDTLHLARFAGTGPEHANECRYYAPAPERSGLQGYTQQAVEETDDGLRVKLARGLRVKTAAEEGSAESGQENSAGNRKAAVTLLGLLHLLWTEGRLNVWYPGMAGKRNPGVVNSALRNAADRISANRMPLSDVLMLAAGKDSRDEARNRARVLDAQAKGRRLLVVAPLARFDQDKHGQLSRLPLAGPFGMPSLWLTREANERMARRFAREMSCWKAGDRVIAIAQLNPRPNQGAWEVAEVALMPVTERWIPVDSGHEAVIEARLAEEGRSFDKPLRFDADEEVVFPDFWLLDVGNAYPLEVFGMATEEYLLRKQRKIEQYHREYGVDGWWSWDAASDPARARIPAFPAPVQRRS